MSCIRMSARPLLLPRCSRRRRTNPRQPFRRYPSHFYLSSPSGLPCGAARRRSPVSPRSSTVVPPPSRDRSPERMTQSALSLAILGSAVAHRRSYLAEPLPRHYPTTPIPVRRFGCGSIEDCEPSATAAPPTLWPVAPLEACIHLQ